MSDETVQKHFQKAGYDIPGKHITITIADPEEKTNVMLRETFPKGSMANAEIFYQKLIKTFALMSDSYAPNQIFRVGIAYMDTANTRNIQTEMCHSAPKDPSMPEALAHGIMKAVGLIRKNNNWMPAPLAGKPRTITISLDLQEERELICITEGSGESRREALVQIIALLKTYTENAPIQMRNVFTIQDDRYTKPSRTWVIPITATKNNVASIADTIMQHAGIRYLHNGPVSTPGFVFPEESCKDHPELLHVRIKIPDSFRDYAAFTDDEDGLAQMAEKITADIFRDNLLPLDAYTIECKTKDASDLIKSTRGWSHHLTAGNNTHNFHARDILQNIGFTARPETGDWHWKLPERVKSQ